MLRFFLAFLIAVAFGPLAIADMPKTPNVVVILADDLGSGDVQRLNPDRGKIKTPRLDKLASQGMTFTDALSGSGVVLWARSRTTTWARRFTNPRRSDAGSTRRDGQ